MGGNSSTSQNAIRCAKAVMLVSSLGSRRHHQEMEIMQHTIDDLKMEIIQQRFHRKNLKFCNLLLFAIRIIFLFSVLTSFLLFAFKFY